MVIDPQRGQPWTPMGDKWRTDLQALLEGLDWRRVHGARETATPMQPG